MVKIMEGGKEISLSPVPSCHCFEEGDLVHVFEGTGVGKLWNRSAGWFGRVVGRDGNRYLVRNRILSAKGSPARVEAEFMKLQADFTLASGSEERVHFRTLSKRTRERILASADEHNDGRREQAEKELVRVKKQKTLESRAHLERREKITEQVEAAMKQSKSDYVSKLNYWQDKSDTLEKQKKSINEHHKSILKQREVILLRLFCLLLLFLVFLLVVVSCCFNFLPLCD